MDAFNTGDTFAYATNDALSCPLVQILAPVDGLAEDFEEGAFRVRPSSEVLVELQNSYARQAVFKGCASGATNSYNLYFYRQ